MAFPLLGAVAKAALAIGKKIVTKIKDKKAKKVEKKAAQLVAAQDKLAQAQALVDSSGIQSGAGVSGASQILQTFKDLTGSPQVDPSLVTQANLQPASDGFDKKTITIIALVVAAIFLLPKLLGRR